MRRTAAQIISAFIFAAKIPKSVIAFCGLTVRFVWDLVRNPEDRFSQEAVHSNMVFQKKEHNNSLVSITYTSFDSRELASGTVIKFNR